MKKTFYFCNITNNTKGTIPREGDYIKSINFNDGSLPTIFNDGWIIKKQNNELGIEWGTTKEFMPFSHFASRTIFTIGSQTLEEIQSQNTDGDYFAIGNNGEKYEARYNAKLRTMFFCIPDYISVKTYIKR